MKTSPSVAIFCLLSLMLCGGPLLAQQSNQGQMPADAIHTGGPAAAQAALEVWMGLVDDAEYAKAWDSASTLYKKAVSQAQWNIAATGHRTPLGKMLSRKLRSAVFSKSLPDAPAGNYVIVVYDTSFQNKKTAVETVTAMLDVDGQWRLSGYMVR